jgi:hypothetical protein
MVDEARFDAMRHTFVMHNRLKELVSFLVRRIERSEDESIYFLTLLFVAEDFINRFLNQFDNVRQKCMDSIFSCLSSLLSRLEFADNPQVPDYPMLFSCLRARIHAGSREESCNGRENAGLHMLSAHCLCALSKRLV